MPRHCIVTLQRAAQLHILLWKPSWCALRTTRIQAASTSLRDHAVCILCVLCVLYSVCSECSVFSVRALRTQRIQAAWTSLQDRTGLRGLLVPPPTSLAQHLLVVRGFALTGTVLLADPFLPVVRAAQLFAKIHFPQPHSFGCSLNQWLSFNSSDSFGESLDESVTCSRSMFQSSKVPKFQVRLSIQLFNRPPIRPPGPDSGVTCARARSRETRRDRGSRPLTVFGGRQWVPPFSTMGSTFKTPITASERERSHGSRLWL